MPERPPSQALQIKETLISIVISFVMAFVFRGFVIEGFQIPTGSMAPTLLGKHVHVRNAETGSEWNVGPWNYANYRQSGTPASEQVGLELNDPITYAEVIRPSERLRAGDRIFVLKYLRHVHEPRRWDVVVFKNPATQENYIKRLTGLPDEQIALVDGDVFTRPADAAPGGGIGAWEGDGWAVARKPERVQRAMFQTVWDSRYTPDRPGPEYTTPWDPDRPGDWTGLRDGPVARNTRGSGTLAWSSSRPIDDWYPYNQTSRALKPNPPPGRFTYRGPFPVSDVAMSVAYEPEGEGSEVRAFLHARGREFRLVVGSGRASVAMRPEDADAWTELDSGEADALEPGVVRTIEFWHVDQALWAFIDGQLVAGGPERGAYTLNPAERVLAATGRTLESIVASRPDADPTVEGGVLGDPSLYRRPEVRWEFAGTAPFGIHRMTLGRDIHYQVSAAPNQPTFGGDPRFYPHLGPDEFFVCGDNSPASKDARLWTQKDGGPDPWITDQIGPDVGTVDRSLMIGRAFVVYFPAPLRAGQIPVPDVGRVRWIW